MGRGGTRRRASTFRAAKEPKILLLHGDTDRVTFTEQLSELNFDSLRELSEKKLHQQNPKGK